MNRVQNEILEEIMENEDELNEWEAKFVDDLFNKDPKTITTNQNHKLNQIYHKVVFK